MNEFAIKAGPPYVEIVDLQDDGDCGSFEVEDLDVLVTAYFVDLSLRTGIPVTVVCGGFPGNRTWIITVLDKPTWKGRLYERDLTARCLKMQIPTALKALPGVTNV